MRVVLQRVTSASVAVSGQTVGEIDRGLLLLLGVAAEDTPEDGAWLAQKIARLRLFDDATGHLTCSVQDIGGGVLVISQFTLLASTRKGTRPSWDAAARPEQARPLYEQFLGQLEATLGHPVPRGEFGADMQVSLVNDGPVTLVIDSRRRE